MSGIRAQTHTHTYTRMHSQNCRALAACVSLAHTQRTFHAPHCVPLLVWHSLRPFTFPLPGLSLSLILASAFLCLRPGATTLTSGSLLFLLLALLYRVSRCRSSLVRAPEESLLLLLLLLMLFSLVFVLLCRVSLPRPSTVAVFSCCSKKPVIEVPPRVCWDRKERKKNMKS